MESGIFFAFNHVQVHSQKVGLYYVTIAPTFGKDSLFHTFFIAPVSTRFSEPNNKDIQWLKSIFPQHSRT